MFASRCSSIWFLQNVKKQLHFMKCIKEDEKLYIVDVGNKEESAFGEANSSKFRFLGE
jgi:hypothetical protein